MKAKKNKENPLTFFRKANEARQDVVKKSLKKAKDGGDTEPSKMTTAPGSKFYKTNRFGKTKEIDENKYIKKYVKYSGKPGSITSKSEYELNDESGTKKYSRDTIRPKASSNRSVSMVTPTQKKGGVIKSKKK